MSCCAELLCSLGVGRAEPRGLSPRLIKPLYPLPRRSPDHALEPNDQSSPALKRRVSSQNTAWRSLPRSATPPRGGPGLFPRALSGTVCADTALSTHARVTLYVDKS